MAYNAWATAALIDFCRGLDLAELKLTAGGTLGSIERTLTLGANGLEAPDISVGGHEDELSPNATQASSVRNPDLSGRGREEE